MKITEFHDIVSSGGLVTSRPWALAWADVRAGIRATDWPHGSGKFTIYPESGKKRGKGNGVKPIKLPCVTLLEERGWTVECVPPVERGVLGAGDLDALLESRAGCIAFEWETGNVSSSLQFKQGNRVAMEQVREAIRRNGFTPKGAEVRVLGALVRQQEKFALAPPGSEPVLLVVGLDSPDLLRRLQGVPPGTVLLVNGLVPETEKGAQATIQVRSFATTP